MKSEQEKLLDCVTYYAIENWDKLTKRAEHWFNQQGDCVPVSVQLAEKFNICEATAAKIARDVAAMKHCGIV